MRPGIVRFHLFERDEWETMHAICRHVLLIHGERDDFVGAVVLQVEVDQIPEGLRANDHHLRHWPPPLLQAKPTVNFNDPAREKVATDHEQHGLGELRRRSEPLQRSLCFPSR